MNIDILFQDIEISKWDDEPVELVALTAEELGNPPYADGNLFPTDEYQPGDGMPTASNGFPPAEWL